MAPFVPRPGEIITLGIYHPYWLPGRVKNPSFDQHSGFCLDLKGDAVGTRQGVARLFASAIRARVPPGAVVVGVPPHTAGHCHKGVRDLVDAVCAKGGLTNGANVLRRHTAIPKLVGGGNRSVQTHTQSITVDHQELVEGRTVVVLDDVATTGNSLVACRSLLLKAGAVKVIMIAVGGTSRESPEP